MEQRQRKWKANKANMTDQPQASKKWRGTVTEVEIKRQNNNGSTGTKGINGRALELQMIVVW